MYHDNIMIGHRSKKQGMTMTKENEGRRLFKPSGMLRAEIKKDLEFYIEQFRDPVILGELMYKLSEERENTNRLLKTILQKIEELEKKLEGVQGDRSLAVERSSTLDSELSSPLLSEVEERILSFIKEKGKVTAEDVRKAFGYKGRNAASARLNHLYKLGLLDKKQVGRKVVFMLLNG